MPRVEENAGSRPSVLAELVGDRAGRDARLRQELQTEDLASRFDPRCDLGVALRCGEEIPVGASVGL